MSVPRLLFKLKRILFPPHCAACRALLPYDAEKGQSALCLDCRSEWEMAKLDVCPDCGKARMDCRCMPAYLEKSGAAFLCRLVEYDAKKTGGRINSLINNIKKYDESDVFDFLADQMASSARAAVEIAGFDAKDVAVTYSPRSRAAHRREGFDQSQRLARRLASRCGYKYLTLLRRRRLYRASLQKELSVSERRKNAARSLMLSEPLGEVPPCVVLLDDVVTTGATLGEATRLLRRAGVGCVICVCIATARGMKIKK